MFYSGGKKNTFGFQVFLEDISLYTLVTFDSKCTSGLVMVCRGHGSQSLRIFSRG